MKYLDYPWLPPLTAGECDAIVAAAERSPAEQVDTRLVRYPTPTPEWGDILDRLYDRLHAANEAAFQSEITGGTLPQYLEYHATREAAMHPHTDLMFVPTDPAYSAQFSGEGEPYDHKVSLIVQLSAPSEYEGGQFQFLCGPRTPEQFGPKGSILTFPSFRAHQVTPVTKGIRRALVLWGDGPRWR